MFSISLWKVRPPIEARVVLIRDTHGLFARVPIADSFFHVGPDSSHNTSKVTKAEGKQIRGRALTGLLNTRASRRWSPSSLKVATTQPADEDDGDVDAAWPSSRTQACITSYIFISVPPCREGQKRSSLLLYVRKTKTISLEVGKNGRKGGVK